MFTLRIIFYGLIALAQDPNRHEGALALLVNDPNHAASVWMVEGVCTEGPCDRIPGEPGVTDIMSSLYRERGLNLVWFLGQEHLTLETVEGSSVENWPQTTAVDAPDSSQAFPANADQTRSLLWVPHLSSISPTAGPLRSACLSERGCESIAARFNVSPGLVSSCHLVHEGNGDQAEVHAFDFRSFGSSSLSNIRPQAIADAVMVEIKVNGSAVRIASRPFAADDIQHRATLTPQQGRVTLVVSNNDYSGQGSHHHFEHYYKLTEQGATLSEKPVPHAQSKQKLDPGHCEQILDAFEKALGVSVDGVHNHRECDMVQIPVP